MESKKPVKWIRCKDCGGRIPIYSDETPYTYYCPKCGLEGNFLK